MSWKLAIGALLCLWPGVGHLHSAMQTVSTGLGHLSLSGLTSYDSDGPSGHLSSEHCQLYC
jgi:hypothetical protein